MKGQPQCGAAEQKRNVKPKQYEKTLHHPHRNAALRSGAGAARQPAADSGDGAVHLRLQ